ncbi:MAG: amidohydrolase family protein [Gammaproteobacteria bacterium]|nr:amidohydrolase family protein [Gammaproteobacteria bacterium]
MGSSLTRIPLSFVLLGSFVWPAGSLAGEQGGTREYTVFSGERPIGHMKSADTGDRLISDLDIKDNGRGPTSHVEYTFDADGVLIAVRMMGKAWFGNPISERFGMSGGRAYWRTAADRGELRLGAEERPHYLTNEFSPDDLALLVTRAKGEKRRSIPLLPRGEASVELLGSHTLDLEKESESVELYAVSGVQLKPELVWLDERGRLFGDISGGFALLRDDAVAARPELERLQDEAETALLATIAANARPAQGLTVIRNVALFDPARGRLLPRATVFVYDQRISAIHEEDVAPPDDAHVVDGAGGTLIPGLWDMHVHLGSPWDGVQHMAAGVTNVRDLGSDHKYLEKIRRSFSDNDALGPHVVASGFIEGRSETNASGGIIAESKEQAVDAVEWYARHGYRAIKIYNSIRPEWVPAMVDAAHARGMHVSGHIPAFMRARDAVAAGYDEINHVNMLFLNFVLKDDEDTRTMLRFTALGERAAGLDLDSPEVQAFISELKRRDIIVDPTLAVFFELLTGRDGTPGPLLAPLIDRLPAAIARGNLRATLAMANRKMDRTYNASGEKLVQMVRRLHDAGVRLVAGTDGWPGIGLIRELQFYVEAGIPPAEVLRIATIGGAEVAGEAHDRGSIEVGKIADLVVLEGNPLEDMRALERVRWVVSEGRVMDGGALIKAAGLRPYGSLSSH